MLLSKKRSKKLKTNEIVKIKLQQKFDGRISLVSSLEMQVCKPIDFKWFSNEKGGPNFL